MGDCIIECVDVFDERRYRQAVVGILTAMLNGTSSINTQVTILYDFNGGIYTPFYRIITIECDGDVVITNTTLDGVTPYTPLGVVTSIPPTTAPGLTTTNAVSHSAEVVAPVAIPAGFIQGTFAVVSGTADFNGVTYSAGSSVNVLPMSFGSSEWLHPAFAITNVTGVVNIHYLTKT